MTLPHSDIIRINNDVRLWIEQEASICIAAASNGSAVELTAARARELAEALTKLADAIDAAEAQTDQ